MDPRIIFGIVAISITIVATLIHALIAQPLDAEDFFVDCFGWITPTVSVGVFAILYGFIFWSWWIMLIIVGGAIIITGIVLLLVWKFYWSQEVVYVEDNDDENKVNTKYKCPNCAAPIVRIQGEDEYGDEYVEYKCEHCNTYFSKRDLVLGESTKEIYEMYKDTELTDFEEEYFENCDILGFRPYNRHSKKEIARQIDKLRFTYDSQYSVLDRMNAETYFEEMFDEIENYLTRTPIETVKKNYGYYVFINSDDDEE